MSTTEPYRDKALGTISPADIPISALPVVELSADQLKRAIALAKGRKISYEPINGGEVFGDNDSLTSHQIGVIGELAVALFYGLDIDPNVYEFGDGGADLNLHGLSLDVKSTATSKMDLPELLVRADKELTADLYVRAHVISWDDSGCRVRLVGYAPRDVVVDRESRPHPGSKLNYVVPPTELTLLPVIRTRP